MASTVKIGKKYTFDAAHQLVGHKGKCANLHGHTYTVEVWVKGELFHNLEASDDGMVIDYGDLDDLVKPIIEEMDHSLLLGPGQSVLGGSKVCRLGVRSTAENLAMWIHDRILKVLQTTDVLGLGQRVYPNIKLLGVSVSETPKTCAEYVSEV